jgi:serine/threonine protein kinase
LPDTLTHPTPQQLAAFGLGKLPERAAALVAGHLEVCAVCRQVVADLPPDSFLGKVRAAGPGGLPSRAGRPATPDPSASVPPELASHPRFRILRELGRGGMGVVYQARQTMMNRQVVIKVINPSLLDHADALERFHREVQAAAQLAHPNIVTAYDAEQAGQLHMLVMEFVPGQSLAEVLEKQGPLPVAQACDCIRQAALGLQHAFERGMVHRDLKPANLMRTPAGQVKILDFGLAKVVSENRPRKPLTALNSYMGTPEYSAPEQATDARSADIRADLYSLGCTLYCLLSGRPPFQGDTAVNTLLAHLEKEPVPLPVLRPEVPAGLWAVVARLLAKDPAHRYQTPAEVAQALASFCTTGLRTPTQAPAPVLPAKFSSGSGTVSARDTPPLPRLQGKRIEAAPASPRRGKVWQRLIAAAAVLALVLLVVGLVWLSQARWGPAVSPRTPAVAVAPAAVLPQQPQVEKEKVPPPPRQAQDPPKPGPGSRRPQIPELEPRANRELFTLEADIGRIFSVSWSPDGKCLATSSSQDRVVKVWDAGTRQGVCTIQAEGRFVEHVCWSPDSKQLTGILRDRTARVWDVGTGQTVCTLKADRHRLQTVCWSPDGTRLASADQREVKVWDAATGQERLTIPIRRGMVKSVCWSPDSKRLASAGDRMVRVWDAATGQQAFSIEAGNFPVESVSWSPDGKHLAGGGKDVKVWDAENGRELLTLPEPTPVVKCVCWSPDGKRLAGICSDWQVKVWDVASGQEALTLPKGNFSVHSICWSPDGKRLASGGDHGTVTVWDVETGP